MMTYSELKQALHMTGIPFAEDAWSQADQLQSDYGVYALDDRSDLKAGNTSAEKIVEGTVDLFVRMGKGYDLVSRIESAMDSVGASWRVNLAGQYEDSTGLTHWEWVFDCLMG